MSVCKDWPSRPLPNHPEHKEEALLVVRDGDLIFPVFFDHPAIGAATLLGYFKREYEEAKRIISKTRTL